MNSNNIYETFGNVKKKEIPQNMLNLQNKLIKHDLNKPPPKPQISRNTPIKELEEKIFHKKGHTPPKNSTKQLNLRNNLLKQTKSSKSTSKNGPDSKDNILNLTYTKDKSKHFENDYPVNNLKQKETIQGYRQKNMKSLNIREKLMPVDLTEKNERTKEVKKNELNSLPKSKKPAKTVRKFQPEAKNNIDYKKKINELEKENKKLEEEINKLKKELHDKDEIINKQQLKIKEQENSIKDIKINNNKDLDKLMEEIKKIKSIIPFEIFPGDKIMSIIFKSDDQNILYSVLCKYTDKFKRFQNIIYDKYPEYKDYENYFLFNGKKINENETLEENKINDGSIITMYSNYDLK